MTARYAVYYAPPPGSALEAFGRSWLGRDHVTGAPELQPVLADIAPNRLAEITRFPHHYGFHGTLKAPFRLAPGGSVDALTAAAATFAAQRAPFACQLDVDALGRFLAFTLRQPCPRLDQLASACVRAFEPFRAPLTAAEIARRRQSSLTPRQDQQMLTWGYPYVFADFRFHMTLTGPLEAGERRQVLATLRAHVAEVTAAPVPIDAICIYHQPRSDTPFVLLSRHVFQG